MLSPAEIRTFIDSDSASTRKQLARQGQRYYEGDHDIRNYRLFFINADGTPQEDKNRSNIKISHPFFTELVDQEAQYMLSGQETFVRSDIPELQKALEDYFDEDFTAELYEVVTGAVAKGFEYMYAYKDADGHTRFQAADSLGVVEVRAKDTDDGCEYVIYWYIDRIGKDNKAIKRIQVWDKKQTHFFCQVNEGEIVPDESAPLNPRPHTIWRKPGDESTYFDGFGFIPFFRLDNGQKQFSGLKTIKGLIDDYDLMSCGLSNNIQDANEVLYVVKGFEGDNLDELMTNIRAKKHIGIPDSGGDVEIRTIDIPYQARQTKLELDEKNIYRFGMGFNAAQVGDGNVTNIVIKSRYALLDLKCNKLEIRLKQFMRKLLKIVLAEINESGGTDYQMQDVYFDFRREVMANALDNAQIELTDAQKQQAQVNTLMTLADVLDDETLLENICDVLELDYKTIRGRTKSGDDTADVVLDDVPAEEDDAG